MRIATIQTADATTAARVEGGRVVEITGFTDVGALLQRDDWRRIAAEADGPEHSCAESRFDLLIPQPPPAPVPAPVSVASGAGAGAA